MMIVGLSGGFDPAWRLDYDLPYDFMHDAAAVLWTTAAWSRQSSRSA
jgi:hypothetical protein